MNEPSFCQNGGKSPCFLTTRAGTRIGETGSTGGSRLAPVQNARWLAEASAGRFVGRVWNEADGSGSGAFGVSVEARILPSGDLSSSAWSDFLGSPRIENNTNGSRSKS